MKHGIFNAALIYFSFVCCSTIGAFIIIVLLQEGFARACLHRATSSKFFLCEILEMTNKSVCVADGTSCDKTDATADQYCTPPRFDFNCRCCTILTTAISFSIRRCQLVSCGASPLHYKISFDGSHQSLVIIITSYWKHLELFHLDTLLLLVQQIQTVGTMTILLECFAYWSLVLPLEHVTAAVV